MVEESSGDVVASRKNSNAEFWALPIKYSLVYYLVHVAIWGMFFSLEYFIYQSFRPIPNISTDEVVYYIFLFPVSYEYLQEIKYTIPTIIVSVFYAMSFILSFSVNTYIYSKWYPGFSEAYKEWKKVHSIDPLWYHFVRYIGLLLVVPAIILVLAILLTVITALFGAGEI